MSRTMNTQGIGMIEEMDRLYKRSAFPKNQSAFSNTCIYWRPADLKKEEKKAEVPVEERKDSENASSTEDKGGDKQ